MAPGEAECPECGMPAAGVECPSCGALNFRSFCRQCNRPLTRAAIRAVEKARQDPVFIKAMDLCGKAAQLEKELAEAMGDDANEVLDEPQGKPEELSEGARQMMALMEKAGRQTSPAAKKLVPPDARRKVELIRQEYKSTVADVNRLFAEMLPPAGSTPQEQRNYYSARKVAVTEKGVDRIKTGWVCNYCGCFHSKPSECAEPWHGGVWQYDEVETVVKKYKHLD